MKKILPTDPEATGHDPIQANLACLRQCFPQAFTEGKVDFEVLKQLLGGAVDESPEKYGLTWNGKRKARMEALKTGTGTLRPAPEDSVEWDSTRNILIEGDNLEVLKLLRNSYANQVKLIYIDPPYNTGKDFVYRDDYQDNLKSYKERQGALGQEVNSETGGRFHTDWMSMIYPRLTISKDLLNEGGFVFISIDDNELANLKLVCDEVFGSDNFRGCVSRVTGTPTGQGTDRIVKEFDYILIYSRSLEDGFTGRAFDEDDASIYNLEDSNGRYLIRPLRKTGGEDRQEDRPSMYFAVTDPDGGDVYPIGPGGYKSRWRCGPKRYDELLQKGMIEWRKADDNADAEWKVYQKFYLEGRLKQPSNLWDHLEGNKKASRDLNALMDGKVFDFPKPIDLIRECCRIVTSNDDLVLDFFAGSGTTGHAVMGQNAMDGGQRRYILVQLPEVLDPAKKEQKVAAEFCDQLGKPRTIAELTKERLRRAAQKIKAEHPEYTGDLGFRVFKLDSSNLKAWDPDTQNVQQSLLDAVEHIKPGRSTDDVLYELLLKLGLDLAVPMQRKTIAGKEVHAIGGGVLLVCLDGGITTAVAEPLATGIADWHAELKPEGRDTTVVFADSAFDGDVAKSNITAILEQRGLKNVRSV